MRTLLGLVVVVCVGCSSGGFIDNPMVDEWCDDRPCAWEVKGKVARVGTWHTDDYAVGFLGADTTLSQVNKNLTANRARCLGFSMIADIDTRTAVFIELDFLDDGVVDFSQKPPAMHWERRTFHVRTPSWYQGVRFIVRKAGEGRAVLAELRARDASDCRAEPVELRERPDGVPCENDDQCDSGRCRFGGCSYCGSDEECGPDQLCGIAAGVTNFAERCVEPGSAAFGEACSSDAQCDNGICCNGACSQCCPDRVSCEGVGMTCAVRRELQNLDVPASLPVPHQCAPGELRTPTGGPCLSHDDCQTRSCGGQNITCAPDTGDDAGVSVEPPPSICPAWRLQGGTCS